ncbi:MAG: hypothetical protein CMP81_23830 [Fulvimarina sp.]|nr:hypothetical protein [Fulvimarina sp.]
MAWNCSVVDNHLSEAIGIPLELTGQEVRVETFAADILARNPQDDSVVLIENQLEATDHTHLGQIMTYLAGLEAKTVVWIAPRFREPHLSAIRWLNEHTADGFAFFAVKLRVVRIGDSPYAPIFEVVEKPNDWERQVSETKRAASGPQNELGDVRQRFWQEFLRRHPELGPKGLSGSRLSYAWIEVLPERLYIVLWLGSSQSGVYLRGGYGADPAEFVALLAPYEALLAERLGVPVKGTKRDLQMTIPIALGDEARWGELMDRMNEAQQKYAAALSDVLQEVE